MPTLHLPIFLPILHVLISIDALPQISRLEGTDLGLHLRKFAVPSQEWSHQEVALPGPALPFVHPASNERCPRQFSLSHQQNPAPGLLPSPNFLSLLTLCP